MADSLETTQKTAKILVVEDSATQLEELRFLLEESGFAVVTATNGKHGLAAARAEEINVVISDIVMPEMDGYALCRALRDDQAFRHLPVILLTSLADPRDVIKGLESGANNFICKPYDGRALVARVQNVLANQEIRKTSSSEMGINIFFAGQQFFITADRLQILDLLLSTYENAVHRNGELTQARDELRILNEQLEARVAERTAALMAEIEERKRAEEALRASQQILEGILNAIPVRVFWKDKNLVYLGCNAAFARDAGFAEPQEIIGKDDFQMGWCDQAELYRNADREVIDQDCAKLLIEEPQTTPAGDTITLLTSKLPLRGSTGEITGVLGTYMDITARKQAETEREKLEEQLRMSQKMEAIGSLAGGVAHDFNNLLSVILSYTEFAMQAVQEGDPLKDDLLEVTKAADRATALIRQLLAFGRRQMLQPVALSVNEIATGVEKMLRRILGEDIDYVQVLAPDLGVVRADPGQIEQVLMNLVVNARDAMPEGGKLTIETSNVEIDEEYAARHVAVKPGPYVQLTITDTGRGMDAETKVRLFEPFFTTKKKGKGTGLGLSTVYGIVKQSGGNIWIYSELGKGSTFKIYLPRDLTATEAVGLPPPAVSKRVTGTETVLVVEDEEALLKVARRALEGTGYTVLTASNGDEALRTSAQHAGDIHLLLSDVVMPGMSGKALAQALAKTRPGIEVVYMSGYTDNAIVHHGVLDAGTHFLGKPFNAADLTRTVREALDSGMANLGDRHERTVEVGVDAEKKEQPLDKHALRTLSPDVLDRLRKAVIAARYDEIVELIEAIQTTGPEIANKLRRMADLFDYDGMRNLLSE